MNNHLKCVSMHVMCLSLNTKTRSDIEVKWENEWGSKVNGYLVMAIVNVPELVFLLKTNFDFKVNESIFDQNGPYIVLDWTVYGQRLTLFCLYGYNDDKPGLLSEILQKSAGFVYTLFLFCGDCNIVQINPMIHIM
jgi:hypothetical protein